MCVRGVKVFSRVYQVSGVLVSYGLGGKGGSTTIYIYIYISVFGGFPLFSRPWFVFLVTLPRKNSTLFGNKL